MGRFLRNSLVFHLREIHLHALRNQVRQGFPRHSLDSWRIRRVRCGHSKHYAGDQKGAWGDSNLASEQRLLDAAAGVDGAGDEASDKEKPKAGGCLTFSNTRSHVTLYKRYLPAGTWLS